MDEKSSHNEEAAVFQARPSRPTLVRELIIWIVALLPALIGLFHLSVHSLVPFREKQAPALPATQQADTELAGHSAIEPEHPGISRAKHTLATTFPLVAGSCIVTCLILGLLGVGHSLGFAFLQACITTAACLFSDGQGAFVGPVVFTFLSFWPLIGLGKLIRIAVVRAH